jgi:hypothetical protein
MSRAETEPGHRQPIAGGPGQANDVCHTVKSHSVASSERLDE